MVHSSVLDSLNTVISHLADKLSAANRREEAEALRSLRPVRGPVTAGRAFETLLGVRGPSHLAAVAVRLASAARCVEEGELGPKHVLAWVRTAEAEMEKTMVKVPDEIQTLPQDLSKLTKEQHRKVIAWLSTLPLKDLRKRQDLTKQQQLMLPDRDDPASRTPRTLRAANNLAIRSDHLMAAVGLQHDRKMTRVARQAKKTAKRTPPAASAKKKLPRKEVAKREAALTLDARRAAELDKKGVLYVDLDEPSGFYHVFGSESGFAYGGSWSDRASAREDGPVVAKKYGLRFDG